MAEFITENNLNSALSQIFEKADNELIIISPYIKLHERIKSILKTKLKNPNLSITVVFGKNEGDVSKSMNKNDFDFFKQFPNIQIRHEKRLHAKLYSNDYEVLITSMNLYDYSQDTNIESGIIGSTSDKKVGKEAIKYFTRVMEQSELIFEKSPVFESKLMGLSSKYVKSEIIVDNSDNFYSNKNYKRVYKKRSQKSEKKKSSTENKNTGYCIRTGEQIPFDIKMPYTTKSFSSWNKYKDENYPENFCHFSGEKSEGLTTYKSPILRKNWKKAKEKFNL
jgi:RNA polymerase-binding transcription factor DksA